MFNIEYRIQDSLVVKIRDSLKSTSILFGSLDVQNHILLYPRPQSASYGGAPIGWGTPSSSSLSSSIMSPPTTFIYFEKTNGC